MINKKILFFSPVILTTLPFIISCSTNKKVEFFKNEDGTEIKFLTNINFSLEDVEQANKAEKKEKLIVGNFSSTDSKTQFNYSFVSGVDADYFEVDNSNDKKLIYLKESKFQTILDTNKQNYVFDVKAVYKNQYIIESNDLKIQNIIKVEKISFAKDYYQDNKLGQSIKVHEHFEVDVNLNANFDDNIFGIEAPPDKVSVAGATDEDQKTFYSPGYPSEIDKKHKQMYGLPTKPDIIFTSKSSEGTFVSLLELHFISHLINEKDKPLFGISYEKLDGKVVEVSNFEDTRIDLPEILDDPKDYQRTMRFVPIFDKVKKIIVNFKNYDSSGQYAFLAEVLFRSKILNDYTQISGSKALSDHNFVTYLDSNPLNKTNNVKLTKGDEVTFEFDVSKNIKLKQIQLYKAPVAYTDDKQPYSVWKIRQNTLAKYKYYVDFIDNTSVILDVEGTTQEIESLTLPQKYQDKVVKKVKLLVENILELKEIMFF